MRVFELHHVGVKHGALDALLLGGAPLSRELRLELLHSSCDGPTRPAFEIFELLACFALVALELFELTFSPLTRISLFPVPHPARHRLCMHDALISSHEDEMLMQLSGDLVGATPVFNRIEKHVEMGGRHRVPKDRRVGGYLWRWTKALLGTLARAAASVAGQPAERRLAETMSIRTCSQGYNVEPRRPFERIGLADHPCSKAFPRRAVVVRGDLRGRSTLFARRRGVEPWSTRPSDHRE